MSSYLFQKKLEQLRVKYETDTVHSELLNRIVWYSMPIVYGRYSLSAEHYQIQKDYKKAWRIKKHCMDIIQQTAFVPVMITLTFDDKSILFSGDTHKRYVKEFLTKWCVAYYAFVDYGKRTNRKHYHVIACVPPCNLLKRDKHLRLPLPWQYGFYNVKEIQSHKAYKYSAKTFLYASKYQSEHFRSRKSKSLTFYNLPLSYQSFTATPTTLFYSENLLLNF